MNDKTLAVQRMQDYIENHLTESVTLAALAGAAGFSPWYAARIFKELTGLAPGDYIRRLRLSKSALRLRDEKIKVIDAACDLGFESVDGYQRAFRREFGCNPKEYALSPVPLPLFTAYGVKFRELWKKERADMKLTKVNGGHSIAVYQTDRGEADDMIRHGRVDYVVPADYSKGSELEQAVFEVVDQVAAMAKTARRHMAHYDAACGNASGSAR